MDRDFFNSKKLNYKCSGFTLLEVMVAVAIIAIAMTAVLGSQSQSISLASEARFNTTAALLAQDKMAQLEQEGLDNLQENSGDFGDEFPGYQWAVTVTKVDLKAMGNKSENLQRIDLTLSWGKQAQFTYALRLFHFKAGEKE